MPPRDAIDEIFKQALTSYNEAVWAADLHRATCDLCDLDEVEP